MTVKDLKEVLEGMDEDKKIKVWRGPQSVGDLDVYFNKEQVWDKSGYFLHDVYVMYGSY